MGYIIWAVVIAAVSLIYVATILICDQDSGMKRSGKMLAVAVVYILLGAKVVCEWESIMEGITLCFFFAYMVTASYCDACTQQVYRFLYAPSALAGCVYMAAQGFDITRVIPVAAFILLLAVLFGKYFGRADTVAFTISVFFYTHYSGIGIMIWGLLHMLFAISLVIVIKHKKINFRNGNIEPTAFMPYIATTALLLVYISKNIL